MLGFGPSEAQVLGWVIFAVVKLGVLAVRVALWALFKRPWVLVLAVLVLRISPGLRPPGTEELFYLATVVLVLWACICSAVPMGRRGIRAVKARRLSNRALRELERSQVQAWATGHISDPTLRAGTNQALKVWGGWRRGRREVRRVMHGSDLPRGLRKRWNEHLAEQGRSPDTVAEALAEGLFEETGSPWLDRLAARRGRQPETDAQPVKAGAR